MFEVYHLADYYDIEKLNLKTKIEDLHDPPLRSFVTKETLTDCASVASGYKEIFPEFAEKFQLLCLEVFFATFPGDIPEELVAELKDVGKSALQLLGIKNLLWIFYFIIFLQTGEIWHLWPAEIGTFGIDASMTNGSSEGTGRTWSGSGPTKLPSQKSQARGRFSLRLTS